MVVRIFRYLQKLSLDALFLLGCTVFVYGVWLAWRPLGFIVGGIVLAGVAFFSGYRRPSTRSSESEE